MAHGRLLADPSAEVGEGDRAVPARLAPHKHIDCGGGVRLDGREAAGDIGDDLLAVVPPHPEFPTTSTHNLGIRSLPLGIAKTPSLNTEQGMQP